MSVLHWYPILVCARERAAGPGRGASPGGAQIRSVCRRLRSRGVSRIVIITGGGVLPLGCTGLGYQSPKPGALCLHQAAQAARDRPAGQCCDHRRRWVGAHSTASRGPLSLTRS